MQKVKYIGGIKRVCGDVAIALNLDGRVNSDGKRAVRIRVQHKGISRMYSTHNSMTEKEYLNFLKGKYENQDTCMNIMEVFDKFCLRIRNMNINDDFSFNNLNNIIGIGKSQRNTLQNLVRSRIKELENKGQIGTAMTYKDLLGVVNRFSEQNEIPLSAINKTWCKSFMAFMKDRGNADTTISIRTRALSALMNDAVEKYMLKSNPLMKLSIPAWTRKEIDIDNKVLETLLSISSDEVPLNDYIWLQYWKAMLYGNGMDLTDLLHLRWKDINGNMLTFQRRKMIKRTRRDIKLYVRPELNKCITEIFQYKGCGKEYILQDLEGIEQNTYREKQRIMQVAKNINKALHAICELKEIEAKITVKSARHLFATKTLQAGVPIEYISFAMGHSDIKTTINYLQGYTNEQIQNFTNMMSKYIRN